MIKSRLNILKEAVTGDIAYKIMTLLCFPIIVALVGVIATNWTTMQKDITEVKGQLALYLHLEEYRSANIDRRLDRLENQFMAFLTKNGFVSPQPQEK